VLVRVLATTVNSGDWRIRSLDVPPGFGPMVRLAFGLRRPRQPILGTDCAGVVEAVGPDVTRFQPGDEVVAVNDTRMRCHAELVAVRADGAIVPIPAGVDRNTAVAMCFGGVTARRFLGKAGLRPGESVLVNGASGSVGSAAVQLARHLGGEVTGVCSAANRELVLELGAGEVVDYAAADAVDGSRQYDVIVDAVGNMPYARAARALRPGGRLLAIVGGLGEALTAPLRARLRGHRVVGGTAMGTREDLEWLAGLVASGAFRPVIGAVLPFGEIVEAHRLVEGRRKRGSVVVEIPPPG
jgi:NADPH:quinone reductase-like Zn-dependent oxidoreductase